MSKGSNNTKQAYFHMQHVMNTDTEAKKHFKPLTENILNTSLG